jgi:hypothetical protein
MADNNTQQWINEKLPVVISYTYELYVQFSYKIPQGFIRV